MNVNAESLVSGDTVDNTFTYFDFNGLAFNGLESIIMVLFSGVVERIKTGNGAFCGNRVVEEGEECDHGYGSVICSYDDCTVSDAWRCEEEST